MPPFTPHGWRTEMNLLISVLKAFKRRKSNLIFPVISVAVGVMLVVLVSSVGAVGKNAVLSEMSGLGLGGLMISPKEDIAPLTTRELGAIRDCGSVSAATPIVYGYCQIECAGRNEKCLMWGSDDKTDDIMNLPLVFGRAINAGDVAAQKRVCLIESAFAKECYGRENIVGKRILLDLSDKSEIFTVIGVIDGESSLVKSVVNEYIPHFVYVPYSIFESIGGEYLFNNIAVNVKPSVGFDSAETEIKTVLCEASAMHDVYKIKNMFSYTSTIENIFSIVTIILSGIAAISLVVSGMSVMTVMLYSVGERKHEIGIKKAIGASFWDIMFEFLLESVIITLLGCVIGVLSGLAFSFIGCAALNMPLSIDTGMILICAIVTAIFGLVFGIYPASRAAKLNPVDALRQK